MIRGAWGVGLVVAVVACSRDPSYTLPSDASPPPSVQLVQSAPGTMDLGSDTSVLCVIQSVSGFLPAPALGDVAEDAQSLVDASADVTAASTPIMAPALANQINLYVDRATGTWHLASSGQVTATVACADWSAFGGPHALARFDNGGVDGVAQTTVQTGGSQGDCYLSDVEGDYVAAGNGATLGGGALIVTDKVGDGIYASATCFGDSESGGVPFQDFPVDARSGTLDVSIPSSSRALCGLSALSSFAQADSSLAISEGNALGLHSLSTVRCFLFDVADAQ